MPENDRLMPRIDAVSRYVYDLLVPSDELLDPGYDANDPAYDSEARYRNVGFTRLRSYLLRLSRHPAAAGGMSAIEQEMVPWPSRGLDPPASVHLTDREIEEHRATGIVRRRESSDGEDES